MVWPGWALDLQLVAVWGPKLAAALGSVAIAALLARWLLIRPDGSDPADTRAWLLAQGFANTVADAIADVLTGLWTAAWAAGSKAAGGAADSNGLAASLAHNAAQWLDQIADTTVKRLAEILSRGGATEESLRASLTDPARAEGIAQTEVTRVMAEAALAAYTARGETHVRWITEPPNPCPACLLNEAKGAWPIGVPFPSGAMAPPDHPNCRCALIPAESH